MRNSVHRDGRERKVGPSPVWFLSPLRPARRSERHPFACIILAALLMTVGVQTPVKAETGLLFGTAATRYEGLTPFPKWTGALERYFARRGNLPGDCNESRFNQCHFQRWQDLKAELAGQSPDTQLRRINDFMNRYRYILDPINWGVKDYWASPDQFFAKFGDCEDYAIAKYFSLRALGWPAEMLRIVVLQDLNLNIAHAVLVVEHDGKSLVLDNQIAIVVEQSRIHHYRPIYSVNETGWWRHKPSPGGG